MSETPLFPFAPPIDDVITPPLAPLGSGPLPPLSRVQLPTGQVAWLVTGHEEVRQLLRSPVMSSDNFRPGYPVLQPVPRAESGTRPGFFISMDPPDHTKFRRILTPEFMIRSMRRLEPLVRDTVEEALTGMAAAGPPADLVEHFALPVPSMVICHLLGVPYSDHDLFQSRSRTLIDRAKPPLERQNASLELRAYLAELVARKQVEGTSDDLIGRLAVERVATGEMTVPDLVGVALLLLIAGHETTANMIGLSALVLLQHPEQLRRLREKPELIDDTVEELLRFLTVVRTGLARVATEDIELGGQQIQAGDGLIALLPAANRDGAIFPDPGELDIARGSHQHMAFGFGIHQCIGQPLARSELKIALLALFQRFPDLALAVDVSEVEGRNDAVVYGLEHLPVTW
jgi:cytochrome P450